jgi:hypothetical protein
MVVIFNSNKYRRFLVASTFFIKNIFAPYSPANPPPARVLKDWGHIKTGCGKCDKSLKSFAVADFRGICVKILCCCGFQPIYK